MTPSRDPSHLGFCREIAETTPNCQPARYLASAGSSLCGSPRKTLTWQYVAWSSAQVRGEQTRRPVIADRCAMRPRHTPGSRNSSLSRVAKSHSHRATTRSSRIRVSTRPAAAGERLLWLASGPAELDRADGGPPAAGSLRPAAEGAADLSFMERQYARLGKVRKVPPRLEIDL